MSTVENSSNNKVAIISIVAALVALVGLADSVYLTVEHYKGELPPCSLVEGCEVVLTSVYAEIYGVPLALVGAVGYFLAFSLAILAGFGNRVMWLFFGVQATIMAIVSAYLLYIQGVVLEHFCQYCLISAGTSFALFILFVISKFLKK